MGKISKEEYEEAQEEDEFYLLNDVIGKGGLESAYESELRGEYGRRQVEVDSYGTLKSVVAEDADIPGRSLILSIDKDFQEFIRKRLEKTLQAVGSKAGTVVALDPQSGDVLALVSSPSFDPNLFAQGISQDEYSALLNDEGRPLFHRAVSGTYPPGSTVKPMVAAVALDEGVITQSDIIVDRGVIEVPHEYTPDIIYSFVGWNRDGLGAMDVFSAIAKSSDIYFYTISGGHNDRDGLGKERLAAGYRLFGLGSPLGIDMPGESAGLVLNRRMEDRSKRGVLVPRRHVPHGNWAGRCIVDSTSSCFLDFNACKRRNHVPASRCPEALRCNHRRHDGYSTGSAARESDFR